MMYHCGNPYIVERLDARTMRIISRRRREIRLVTVDECPFDEERHHAKRVPVLVLSTGIGILTDLTTPFPFFVVLFTARYIPIYSLVIGFARHRAASAREISARDRSFQPREKFMSSAGCKTSKDCVINKYWNASIYSIAIGLTASIFNFGMQ